MTGTRSASIARETSESSIRLSIDLDGTGASSISTTVPFFDHMLTAFAKHSLCDLTVDAHGDTDTRGDSLLLSKSGALTQRTETGTPFTTDHDSNTHRSAP